MYAPTIKLSRISTECLIAIANDLQQEIDNPATGFESHTRYVGAVYNTVCAEIESRGIELADYVVCPHAEGTWESTPDDPDSAHLQ